MGNRESLAKYLGERAEVKGEFQNGDLDRRAACVADMCVLTEDGEEHDIDHTWVQRAGEILEANPQKFDRLTFSAVITEYQKDGETRYGLTMPRGVDVKSSGIAPRRSLLDYRRRIIPNLTQVGDMINLPAPATASVLALPAAPPAPANYKGALRAAKRLMADYGAEGAAKLLGSWDELNSAVGEFGREELVGLVEELAAD